MSNKTETECLSIFINKISEFGIEQCKLRDWVANDKDLVLQKKGELIRAEERLAKRVAALREAEKAILILIDIGHDGLELLDYPESVSNFLQAKESMDNRQRKIDEFNSLYRIGTDVDYWLNGRDGPPSGSGRTSGAARLKKYGYGAEVSVEGIGRLDLRNIEPKGMAG